MKRTTTLVLVVIIGLLLSDIQLAQGLKCYVCNGCNGKKGTETECKPPNDSTCIIHAGLGIVQRDCANEAAALVPEKCDSTDKTCYCTTDLCNGGSGGDGDREGGSGSSSEGGGNGNSASMVIGNSKRTLKFSAVASVAAYLMGTVLLKI